MKNYFKISLKFGLLFIGINLNSNVVNSQTLDALNKKVGYFYNAEDDRPCVPKRWNISDDLGQIEYVFSDKTGTLTQNLMILKK